MIFLSFSFPLLFPFSFEGRAWAQISPPTFQHYRSTPNCQDPLRSLQSVPKLGTGKSLSPPTGDSWGGGGGDSESPLCVGRCSQLPSGRPLSSGATPQAPTSGPSRPTPRTRGTSPCGGSLPAQPGWARHSKVNMRNTIGIMINRNKKGLKSERFCEKKNGWQ